MKTTNQPQQNAEQTKNVEPILFQDQSNDDRKGQQEEIENDEATMDDWGEVDPAGGPAPTAPGSAV